MTSRISPIRRGFEYSAPNTVSASVTVSWASRLVVCRTSPILDRQARPPVRGSAPSTWTVPAVGARNPSRISIVVVLPAPFGPSSAVTCPEATSKLTSCTAVNRP
jgi:hypothetical protein